MIDHRQDPTSTIAGTLASNLRRLRVARHLSLSELARATSISKATLSGIESGSSNPTAETLAGLAGALRVTLGELLEELPPPEIRVLRARGSTSDDGPLRVLERLTTGAGETLALAELELPAGDRHEHPPRPPGTRLGLFVLEGKLIAGPVERCTELGTRDYMVFPADVAFVLETGRRPARVLTLERGAG